MSIAAIVPFVPAPFQTIPHLLFDVVKGGRASRQMISAIKVIRNMNRSGGRMDPMGLKEAKDYVEAVERVLTDACASAEGVMRVDVPPGAIAELAEANLAVVAYFLGYNIRKLD